MMSDGGGSPKAVTWDDTYVTNSKDLQRIRALQDDWKETNDKKERDRIHAEAERIRNKYRGDRFEGNPDGTTYELGANEKKSSDNVRTHGGGVREFGVEQYERARDSLWDTVYKQYPGAQLRFNKKKIVESALKEYKDVINEAGKKYGVPPEIIAGIIVKEQMTQSAPDSIAIIDTLMVRGYTHSSGLGAIFPKTAKEAWAKVDRRGAYKNRMYESDDVVELILAYDDETNIKTIAVVLNYYARQKFEVKDVSNLTMEQWKYVIGRYNSSDENPKGQEKYSNYVNDYLEPLKIMMK